MSEMPVNLNKARKARDRAAEKAQADANAVKHGRTKAQRVAEAAAEARMARALDAHRFDDEG